MSQEQLLREIATRRLTLISEREVWPDKHASPQIRRAVQQHQGYLAALLEIGDIRVCANPDLHRRSWRYIGGQHFVCDVCQRLNHVRIC